jgi:hypothetical protein
MKIITASRLISFAFIFSCCLLSCLSGNNITRTVAFPRVIEKGKKDKNYFIMQSGVDVYRIKSIEVEKSKQQFTVLLDRVDSLHLAGKKKNKSLNEKLIELHMKDSTSYTLDEPHTIALNKVASIQVVD